MKKDTIAKSINPENQKLIDIFNKLYQLIEIKMDNETNQKELTSDEFRLRTLKRVIKIIQKFKNKINNGKDLEEYSGVGKKTILKIDEIINTGRLEELDELEKKYAKDFSKQKVINELLEIVGIGRNTAIDLIDKYNIKSLDDLKNRVKKGEIELNDKLMIGLKYAGKFQGNIPRKEMDDITSYLRDIIEETDNLTCTFCGSYRRGLSSSNDIDILLCHLDLLTLNDIKKSNLLKDTVDRLKKKKFIIDDIAGDDIKTKYMGFCKWKKGPPSRVDIRLIPFESYIPALVYFTGSYEFNKIMRMQAKKLGMKLSEYGLFKNNKNIYVATEEELFKLLDMKYLKPEERNIV